MQYDNRLPIYLQVIDKILKRLVRGEIKPGDRLPSSRALAVEYGVNPNTAARIYNEMESMGLCYTERGTGTFMTKDPEVVKKVRKEMAERLTHEFVREMLALGFSVQELKQAVEEEAKK